MDSNCLLCRKYLSKIFESRYFFVIYDDCPLRQGHLLIIPIRHVEQITDLTRAEFCNLHYVINEMVKHLQEFFRADGYNIGVNCGEAAGQTLSHLHIHLIPRHFGDVPNPRGGIRKFLPNPLSEYPVCKFGNYSFQNLHQKPPSNRYPNTSCASSPRLALLRISPGWNRICSAAIRHFGWRRSKNSRSIQKCKHSSA